MSEPTKIEYRVIATERYIVTRYQEDASGGEGSLVERGRYSNPEVAQEVAYALAKDEHERLGWLPGDERIIYPKHPKDAAIRVTGSFAAPVADVLAGASGLQTVALVGIDEDGNDYVAGSGPTPEMLGLFKRARENIRSGRYS